MAQHDYVISNGTGAAVRSDLNNALSAIVTQNSGSTEPTTTYAYQMWADTNAGVMKIRNGANSAWITLYQLDGEWTSIAFENGSAAAPSIYFKDSGTDTGFFSGGTDQVNIATAGTERVEWGTSEVVFNDAGNNYDFRVEGDTNANLLFVDASADAVGIGTSSPSYILHVNKSGDVATDVAFTNSGGTAIIGVDYSGGNGILNGAGANDFTIRAIGGTGISFGSGYNAPSMRLTSTGRLGIGTTTPSEKLQVDGNILAGAGGQIMASSGAPQYGSRTANSVLFLVNNSEAARLDADKRLLVGTSSSSYPALLQVSGNTTSSTGHGILQLKKGGDALYSGNDLGAIWFGDNIGGNRATIEAQADGTGGAGDLPSRLVFSTTADGAASPTERAKITSEGYAKFTTDGTYVSTTGYHEFTNSKATSEVLYLKNTTTTNPYGITIKYSAASPNGTASEFLYCADSTLARATIRSNGGLANFQANNVNLSDINTKKDISPAAGTWDCIKEWEIVNYRYKDQPDDADLNLGVIAQQVAESCPEVITVFQEAKEATEDQPAQEERLGIKEQQMYWMAIKALQEAQVRIEALEAEVAALKAQ